MQNFGEKSLLIIIGGIVSLILKAFWDSSLKRKNDVRDRCKCIEEIATNYERRSSRYWILTADDPTISEVAREVKSLGKNLGSELGLLAKKGFKMRNSEVALTVFRKAATSDGFELRGRPADSSKIGEIQDAAVRFKEELRKSLDVL
ncbi:MAG: hypothetical protein H8E36_11830 [Rhodospirillaceae bacterium]|nr:hypothetical protein [Rhodospirillaceae bacterium]